MPGRRAGGAGSPPPFPPLPLSAVEPATEAPLVVSDCITAFSADSIDGHAKSDGAAKQTVKPPAGPGSLVANVKIVAAKGLKNRDWGSNSDPYCEVFVNGVKKGQTEVLWNNLNPQWGKSITIRGLHFGDELEFKLWDDDRDLLFQERDWARRRESLGSCKLPLPAVGETRDEWLQVAGTSDEVGDGESPQLHVVLEVKEPPGSKSTTGAGSAAGPRQGSSRDDLPVQLLQDLHQLREKREKREEELVRQHSERRWSSGSLRASWSLRDLRQASPARLAARGVLAHWAFDPCMGLVICMNAVTIAVESTYSSKDLTVPSWVEVLEYMFLLVYTVELAMRVFVFRAKAFASSWVVFDAFLVISGLVDILVKLIASSGGEVLANMMFVRLLRLARLARAARLLVQFRVLWLLVQGLTTSFMTIMWTFVIMLVLIYIFAILGMELMRPDEAAGVDYGDAITNFDSLGRSMLFLVQFMILDSVGPTYVAICLAKPYLALYFVSYLLIVSISLTNLVTSLMVDSARSQSSQDKEAERAWEAARRKKSIPKLKQMFYELDDDASGLLDLDELKNAPDYLKTELQQVAKMDTCEELFEALDYDGSGTIDVDEFCDGVLKASQENRPLELLRLVRQCTAIHHSTKATLQLVQDICEESAVGDPEGGDLRGPGQKPDGASEQTVEPPARPGSLVANVKIVAAKGLKNRDWGSNSDPYCEVFVNGVKKGQTEVQWNNLNPQWDKSITIRGLLLEDELEFKVWDDDRVLPFQNWDWARRRESLGSCKLPLPAVGETRDGWLEVAGASDEVGDGEPPQLHVVLEVEEPSGSKSTGAGSATGPRQGSRDLRWALAGDQPAHVLQEAADGGEQPRAAEASVRARMMSMESRISGVEARLGGMESTLQSIADVLVGPASPAMVVGVGCADV